MYAAVLGIPDPWIWLAYLLCLGATTLCVVYAVVKGRQGEEGVTPADQVWVEHEKQAEDEE